MAMGINLDEPVHPGPPAMSKRARRRFFRWLGNLAAKAGRRTRAKIAEQIVAASQPKPPRAGEGGG